MRVWALLSFTACGVGLLLCGCGSSAKPTPVAPAGNALAGNWLIVGPMPTNGLAVGTGVRLALTFDVTGSNVTAAGFGNDSCGNPESSFGFGSLATGTIAADGSFTLQSPANFPEGTLSIQGTAPKASDTSWTGGYTISFDGPIVPPTCDKSLTGTFTATPFPPVSGVYVGTGSTETFANGMSTTTPVTFEVSLQQGGMLTNPNGATSPLFSNLVLTGSIRVQGSPCFSSGATAVTPASSVEGNMLHAAFLMNDGSTLNLLGSLTDITEGHIGTNLALVTGGNCGGITTVIRLPGLDRQN
jgi:hypothetical protein